MGNTPVIWSQLRNRAPLFHIQDWDGRVKGNFKNSNFILHMLLCPNKLLCYLKSTVMIVFEWGKNMTTHFICKWPNKCSLWLLSEKLHPNFAFLRSTLLFPVLLQLPTTLWTFNAYRRHLNYFSKHCAFLSICSLWLLLTHQYSKEKPWCILIKISQECIQISRFKGL